MKKVLLALALLLVLLLPLNATALSDSILMYDLGGTRFMTIMPEGWDVIKSDMAADKPVIRKYFTDWNSVKKMMQAQSIYAVAVSPQSGLEIQVSIKQTADTVRIKNISFMSDEQIINALKNSVIPQDIANQPIVQKHGLYKYIRYNKPLQNGLQSSECSTIVNGYLVTISMPMQETMGYLSDLEAFWNVVKHATYTVNGVCAAIPALAVVLAGVMLCALVSFLLLRRKKTRAVDTDRHEKLNRFGGMLILLVIWNLVLGIWRITQLPLTGGWYIAFELLVLLFMAAALVMGFIRQPLFPAAYASSILLSATCDLLAGDLRLALVVTCVDCLLILYLFASKRVAILYQPGRVSVGKQGLTE